MRRNLAIFTLLLWALAAFAEKPKTVEQLKAEAEHSSGGTQAKLYAELAQELVDVADQQFTQGDSIKAHQTVQDVLQYATKARDAAVRSRGKMKETEIHLRETQRRLESVKRTLAAEDRPDLDQVEKKLENLRQDILNAMFSPKKERK